MLRYAGGLGSPWMTSDATYDLEFELLDFENLCSHCMKIPSKHPPGAATIFSMPSHSLAAAKLPLQTPSPALFKSHFLVCIADSLFEIEMDRSIGQSVSRSRCA